MKEHPILFNTEMVKATLAGIKTNTRRVIKPQPVHIRVNGKRVIDHYVSYPWEDIHEEREYRGKRWIVCGNPWVWIPEFKVVNQ